MRQTGYYFVNYNGKAKIAYYNQQDNDLRIDGAYYEIGNDLYQLSFISPTPITPEKMAAIEYVIAIVSKGYSQNNEADDMYFSIKHYLEQHKLI